MVPESLEQRQARTAADAAHDATNRAALAQEAKVLGPREPQRIAVGGAKALAGPPENKTRPPAKETKATDLDKVQFASAAARKAAEDAGLTAKDFWRQGQSSDKGYTVADVREIASA